MELIVPRPGFNPLLKGQATIIHGSDDTTAFEGGTWLIRTVTSEKIFITGVNSDSEEIHLSDVTNGNIELTLLEQPSHKVSVTRHEAPWRILDSALALIESETDTLNDAEAYVTKINRMARAAREARGTFIKKFSELSESSPFQEDERAPSPFNLEDRWLNNKTKVLHRIVDINYEDRRTRVCPLSDSNDIKLYGFEQFQKDYTFYTSYKGAN